MVYTNSTRSPTRGSLLTNCDLTVSAVSVVCGDSEPLIIKQIDNINSMFGSRTVNSRELLCILQFLWVRLRRSWDGRFKRATPERREIEISPEI
jgi:hypothetical protein